MYHTFSPQAFYRLPAYHFRFCRLHQFTTTELSFYVAAQILEIAFQGVTLSFHYSNYQLIGISQILIYLNQETQCILAPIRYSEVKALRLLSHVSSNIRIRHPKHQRRHKGVIVAVWVTKQLSQPLIFRQSSQNTVLNLRVVRIYHAISWPWLDHSSHTMWILLRQ